MSNGKYVIGEVGNTKAYKIFIGNPEGKEHFGGPRRRREDDIIVYFNKQGASKWTEFKWSRK